MKLWPDLGVALLIFLPGLAVAETPAKPALYAVLVGVNAPALSGSKLLYPAKDAGDLATTLRAQSGKAFRSVEVRTLIEAEATRDHVLDGLDWLARQTTARDVALVFLAGQGVDEPRTGLSGSRAGEAGPTRADGDPTPSGRYYYFPADGDPGAVKRSLVSSADLHDALASIAGKAILFLDACRTTEIGARKLRCSSDLEWFARAPARGERPVAVLASSTGGQAASEDPALANGALARAIIDGLSGAADPQHTGAVTVDLLDRYLAGRVRELTHGAQTPVSANLGGLRGLTLALVR